MSIDASVAFVEVEEEGGSGLIHLCDRDGGNGIRGQSRLRFEEAPYEITALNGLNIWGGASQIMLGDRKIATRDGYTRIQFVGRSEFLEAVRLYHERHRIAGGYQC